MELFQGFTGVTPGEAGLASANNYSASSPKMRFHAPLQGRFFVKINLKQFRPILGLFWLLQALRIIRRIIEIG